MLLPVYGRSGTPVDLFDANMPQVLELDCGTHRMLALFNWGEEESAAVVAPVGGPSHAFDVWGNRYLGTLSGAPSLKAPSHGCRLLGVRPVLDRPQVVGTSFHTMQGALEIEHERWDGERLELSLRPVARKAGDIFVHVPGDGQIRAVDGVAAAIEREGDGIWRVAFELREPMTISLAIS